MGIELTGKIISRLAFHKIIITQYCTHGHEIITVCEDISGELMII